MKDMVKNTLILTAITLISGLLLGLVYEITKEPIAVSKEKAKKEAYQQVMADATEFTVYEAFDEQDASKLLADAGITGCSVNEVVVAKAEEKILGYVVTTTSSEGYGGDIGISVGVLKDGTVNGIAFLSISETVGLGMEAKEPEFYNQFRGKKVEAFQVTKSGADAEDEIDALSGATVTSEAVTDAVNTAVIYYKEVLGGVANE